MKRADPKARARLRKAVNSLSLAPLRAARGGTSLTCCLCTNPIGAGDEYRDRGKGRQAHALCVKAVSQELR